MRMREVGQGPLICGRREFLRVGGGLAVASFLSPALVREAQAAANERSSAAARSCILIYLLGGPPHLDMWDLKPAAPAEVRGPFRPISTNVPGLQICEHMPRLAGMADRYALVRTVSHNNHNHTPMMYYTLTGRSVEQPLADNDLRPPQRTDFPHIGAVLARFKPPPVGLPGFIAIPELATRSSVAEGESQRPRVPLRGGRAGFLGPKFDPLPVDGKIGTNAAVPALALPKDVTGERLERRSALLSVLEHCGRSLANTNA